jgi:hypothetical protein
MKKQEQIIKKPDTNIKSKTSPIIVQKSSSPWGNSTTSQIISSPTVTHTLFDIINEEMNKLTIPKVKSQQVINNKTDIVSSPPKGWNLTNIEEKNSKTPTKSISQIMAMEEQYLKQYHKHTNRNIDLIQLEEKAIEDLKRLYAIENTSDMRITVELVQDTDLNVLSSCVPKWKKQ